jgi:hypothetical protein
MTNIIPFPKRPIPVSKRDGAMDASYEFTDQELATLYRWYSAMRYAFPGVQGIMAVCHNEKVSAIGLYGEGGTSPRCLLSKHEAGGRITLLWATEPDLPRVIGSLAEVTDAQITAIAPPPNEAAWLDAIAWMQVLTNRTVAGALPQVGLSPGPA